MPVPSSADRTPRKITVDFSGVDIRRGAGGIRVEEGDYLLEIRGVKRKSKKDDPSRKYLEWECWIVKPTKMAGKGPIYQRTSLSAESLWALRTFLVDLLGERRVPQDTVEIPLEEIVAKKMRFGATVADGEPYNGKVKSEIKATFSKTDYDETSAPSSDDDEEEEDEEEEAPRPAKARTAARPTTSRKKAPVDEDEDEDEEDEIDVDDI